MCRERRRGVYEVRSLPFGFELCYPIQHKLKSHLTAPWKEGGRVLDTPPPSSPPPCPPLSRRTPTEQIS